MSHSPLWLQSPAMRSLLNLIVDRLEAAEQRGSSRPASIRLTERTWPALYRADRESEKEHLWEHLRTLTDWGWLSIKPDHAARHPGGYADSPRITIIDAAAIRLATGRAQRQLSASEQWRQAVHERLKAAPDVKAIVANYCIDIPERGMAETVERLNLLPELAGRPLLLREVSSQLFWGMSKVLDKRQALVAALLGTEECPFAESPVQLQIHLPSGGCRAMLFIENQMSFERAVRSPAAPLQGLALIYASGFKGSAQRLRNAGSCSLYYSSQGELGLQARQSFETWLFDQRPHPCFFWGDLDWSGMRILSAMRANFPELQAWQPGYEHMLGFLRRGLGHAPEAADKQGQQPVSGTGCPYADTYLLPALLETGRFVDQEQVILHT